MAIDSEAIYNRLRLGPTKYIEEIHCPMLLKVLGNPDEGTRSAFCIAAFISEKTFERWLVREPFFLEVYGLARMFARENWEEEGRRLRDHIALPGAQDCKLEVWRIQGWARHGIGKNSAIRLHLDPDSTPLEHYRQLIDQASDGAFTAGEFKQIMEVINGGLNVHQVFAMQEEIDQLKSDLKTMSDNSNVQNSFTNKGIA